LVVGHRISPTQGESRGRRDLSVELAHIVKDTIAEHDIDRPRCSPEDSS
jgi:hypothetical protein